MPKQRVHFSGLETPLQTRGEKKKLCTTRRGPASERFGDTVVFSFPANKVLKQVAILCWKMRKCAKLSASDLAKTNGAAPVNKKTMPGAAKEVSLPSRCAIFHLSKSRVFTC